MFRDFIVNAGILIAFLSICYQIFGNTGLNPKLPLNLRLRIGLLFGIMGVALVELSVRLTNHLILDLRILPIFIASLYGGFIPGIISSIIIAIFRIFRFGYSLPALTASIATLILPLLTYPVLKHQKKLWKRWLFGISISVFTVSLNYVIFLPDLMNKILTTLIFYLISALVGYLLYFYVGFLEDYTLAFRKFRQEANRDFLTGLNNVRQFDTVYNNVIAAAKASDKKIALLFLDIDLFKKVNDTYGHREGDIVLKTLGEILLQCCRSIDIVSRNGGEEFSVILLDCEPAFAMEIAERIRLKVESTPFVLSDGFTINITISIGIACYPDKISESGILKEKADEALYAAKRSGRNKSVMSE
ncbi:MAG: diguanylate cyclase [Eubacterium sp.]|nr:diguanylate cyclase [Eubacterium sp.]